MFETTTATLEPPPDKPLLAQTTEKPAIPDEPDNIPNLEPHRDSAKLIEELHNTRDNVTALRLLREYIKLGGKSEDLNKSFASSPTKASAEKPFNPEFNYAQQLERDRLQFLQENRQILLILNNTPETKQTLKNKIIEYTADYSTTPEELLTELDADLSPLQKATIEEINNELKLEDDKKRQEAWKTLKSGMTATEKTDLAEAARSSVIKDALHLSTEEEQKIKDMAKDETPTSPEPLVEESPQELVENSDFKGRDYVLLLLGYMLNPDEIEDRFNKLIKKKVGEQLRKAGFSEGLINLLEYNYNSSRESLRLRTTQLKTQLLKHDRHTLKHFLEDLNKEERVMLVTGEDRRHRFPKDERQELFYAQGKLTKNDCEYLEIPTDAK